MSDQEIIARAQLGDKAAYTVLIEKHQRTVEKFAFQCGVKVHDIPDVTQEVFVKLYRFLHQFKQERFTTWLYKITLNATRDYYRKENKEKQKEEKLHHASNGNYSIKSAEDRVLVFEEDKELHQAIQRLDEKYRYPIILFYFHDLSYEQMADVLNVPLTTVKTRMLRAKGLLKKQLSTSGGVKNE